MNPFLFFLILPIWISSAYIYKHCLASLSILIGLIASIATFNKLYLKRTFTDSGILKIILKYLLLISVFLYCIMLLAIFRTGIGH